jgi:hypothetical protein
VIQLVYVPDHAKRRIRVQMQGAITAADTVAYIDQRITEGTRGYSVLYDTGEAGSLATSEDIGCVIRHLQTLEASLGCSGPVAIVSRSRRAFSVPREYPADDHDGRALRFFDDVGDAERWLDHELTRTVDQLRTFSTVIPVAHRIGPS